VKILSLKVTTFSSKGRATRIYGYKTKRIHHLQSDNQLRFFLILEWHDKIKDIKENIELKDIEATVDNVDDLRLDKFSDKETGELFQLHTNFLITVRRNNGEEQVAISVKSLSELERRTVIEKLEIERRFWKAKGIRFYVITEKEINKQLVDNIKWVRETVIDKSIEGKKELVERLYYFLQKNKKNKLIKVLELFEYEEDIKAGTALFIFRYLLATKEIEVDMEKSIDLNEYISDLIKF
jgi:TnsA endonuclease C terminal./TnsA endonuclease N terminal.